jgi:hypothetical protein
MYILTTYNKGVPMYNFENDARLKNMNPLKVRIIKELTAGSNNKSIEQLLPDIMQINRELQKRNLSFTREETDVIMDILMEQVSPADRRKFTMIRSMMNQ